MTTSKTTSSKEIISSQIEDYPNVFIEEIAVNNTTPLSEIQMTEYSMQDINDFFGTQFSNEYTVIESVDYRLNLTFKEINNKFPIECLRFTENTFYSVYKVKEGGYYYVFWSGMYGYNQTDKSKTIDTESITIHFAVYLSDLKAENDFLNLKENISTAQDVYNIDPQFELCFSMSSKICSYSLLDDAEILCIEYDFKNELKERDDLIFKKMYIVTNDTEPSFLSKILKQDLPQ